MDSIAEVQAAGSSPRSVAGHDPPPRQAASYNRRRATRACIICRTRKTKCDNQRPVCGFCTATGGECRYPDDEGTDHSTLDRGTLAILQRLGSMEKSLTALISGQQQQRFSPPPPSSSSAHQPADPSGWRRPSTSGQQPEGSQPPSAEMICESAEMTIESISKWPVFGLAEAPAIATLLAQRDEVQQTINAENIFDLDPGMVVHLVKNFLSHNHVKNPIFDVDLLWVQVQDFLDHGPGWNGTSCLVFLICALGVLAYPISEDSKPGFSRQADRQRRAELFFQASQRRIGVILHDNSLLAMQCEFLTAVYLMSTLRIFAAWKAFSHAGTQCAGWLKTRGHSVSDQSHVVEESLYWSCLKSELQVP